jgi:hypothetical protein
MQYVILAIGVGIAALARILIAGFFKVFLSTLMISIVTGLITLGFGYFFITKVEAAKYIIEGIKQVTGQDGIVAIGNQVINFDGIGALIQAIRIEDIIYVYISAYVAVIFVKMVLWFKSGIGAMAQMRGRI